MSKSRTPGIFPWIRFAFPCVFRNCQAKIRTMIELEDRAAMTLELMVLLAQPQPNWALLLKVVKNVCSLNVQSPIRLFQILCMRNCEILKVILQIASGQCQFEKRKPSLRQLTCSNFLCQTDGSCIDDYSTYGRTSLQYYNLIYSATDILLQICNQEDIDNTLVPLILKQPTWWTCFERRHVSISYFTRPN